MADIYLKIHQGTGRLQGESLCKSCSNGHWYTDSKGDYARCALIGINSKQPQGKVMDCNCYVSKNLPSLWDMQQTAWTLRTEKGARGIGFEPPKKDETGVPH